METSSLAASVCTASMLEGGADDLFVYELLQSQPLLPDIISELPAPDVPFPNGDLPQAQQVREYTRRAPSLVEPLSAGHLSPNGRCVLPIQAGNGTWTLMHTDRQHKHAASHAAPEVPLLLNLFGDGDAGAPAKTGLPAWHAAHRGTDHWHDSNGTHKGGRPGRVHLRQRQRQPRRGVSEHSALRRGAAAAAAAAAGALAPRAAGAGGAAAPLHGAQASGAGVASPAHMFPRLTCLGHGPPPIVEWANL